MTASTTEELVSTPESANVCVVGQGYVGLPLALAFDEEGHDVTGFDIDDEKIAALDAGRDVTGDFGDDRIGGSAVDFTTDAGTVADATYVVITVPTPLDEHREPDMTYVERTVESVAPCQTAIVGQGPEWGEAARTRSPHSSAASERP